MRKILRSVDTITNGSNKQFDLNALGARGASVRFDSASAGIVNEINIDDILFDATVGNKTRRIANWFWDGADSQQGTYLYIPLFGDTFKLNNNTGGSVLSMVDLWDEPPASYQGFFTSYRRNGTVAAAGTFTDSDLAVGAFSNYAFFVSTDRATTLFIDIKTTSAGVYVPFLTLPDATVGGGVAAFTVSLPGITFRVRLRNDDGAAVLTYRMDAMAGHLISPS